MTPIYSIVKKLMPRSIRTFVRDLDTAYHKLENKVDIQQQQIQELEILNIDLQTTYERLILAYQELQQTQINNLDSQLVYYFNNLTKGLIRKNLTQFDSDINYKYLQNILPNSGPILLESTFSSAKEIVETFLNSDKRVQNIEGFEGFAPDDAIFDPDTQFHELWSNVGLAGIIASFGYANYSKPSILELGCGPAHLHFFLNRYGINNYVGIDGHPDFIKFNPYLINDKEKFLLLNLQQEIKLCAPNELKFDIIMSFEVLEHIKEEMIDNFIKTIKNHMHSKSVVFCTASLQVFDVHILVRPRDWWLDKFAKFGLFPIKNELYICEQIGKNHPFNWSPDNTNIFALEMIS
ncbi:class I SAM-dependent methyltransferase [Nostoc sp. MS1]|uniref:class I SAM-dependent methyltransferase n=1 Tax=Nostoc sp. MS1 TaxID=2764711 RepID=UPI001CC515EA|nr:class I SAM-dependent methyltransferase [Nostoc sp. MS1]BCL35890.1 hypothetical protein NSMS1_23370 [Nostoc sp. MS1]